jgi:hypothetical protein
VGKVIPNYVNRAIDADSHRSQSSLSVTDIELGEEV